MTPRCRVPARWGAPRGAQVWEGSWGTESEVPVRPPGEKLWLLWGLMVLDSAESCEAVDGTEKTASVGPPTLSEPYPGTSSVS